MIKKVVLVLTGMCALKGDSVDKIMADEQTKLDRLGKVKGKAELDLAQAEKERNELKKEITESYIKFDEQVKKDFEALKTKHLDKLNALKLDNLNKAIQADNTVDTFKVEIERADSYINRLS